MTLCGSYGIERVVVHPDDERCESHYIEMITDKDEPKFSVTNCCYDEWMWEFWYSKTNYDIVKYLIMDCIMVAETMDDLIEMLDEAFEEYCGEILYIEDEDEDELEYELLECDGDCANCGL